MRTLGETLRGSSPLDDIDVEWLHLVVGDWELIADLSFSDLVLWVPDNEDGWTAVAQVRPSTGPMVFFDDVVGQSSDATRREVLDQAFRTRQIQSGSAPAFPDHLAVREEAVPVVRGGKAIAVMTRHTNVTGGRTPGRLELTYRSLADALARMVSSGEFPSGASPTGLRRGAPRVGDGVINLDAEGVVRYASPNAISAIHRLGHLGDVVGEVLAQVVAELVEHSDSPVDESLVLVVTGRAPWRTDVETRSASVAMRAIPLTRRSTRDGALLLVRDVSELRRREQELLTKDATIREIHHRVKNNLQTVAALLRLQARRIPDPAARVSLDEAVRRVGTIALVHETLSQGFDETVDFDEIALRGLKTVVEVATSAHLVECSVTGTFGALRAEDATPLAMIMSELIQNSVEHGCADRDGRVDVGVSRQVDGEGQEILTVTITDDGMGLPAGFRPVLAGLGTRIVTALVQDLGGRIRWENATPRGTKVEFTARLRPVAR